MVRKGGGLSPFISFYEDQMNHGHHGENGDAPPIEGGGLLGGGLLYV
jgi:hypothetical protein